MLVAEEASCVVQLSAVLDLRFFVLRQPKVPDIHSILPVVPFPEKQKNKAKGS